MFDYLPAKLPIFISKICSLFVKNVDSIVESKKVLESVNPFWRYSFTNYYKWLQTEGVMLPFIKRVQECCQWEGPICIMCSCIMQLLHGFELRWIGISLSCQNTGCMIQQSFIEVDEHQRCIKPQDSFGRFVFKNLIFRKWTIPSESTIKPTGNCFEWYVVM